MTDKSSYFHSNSAIRAGAIYSDYSTLYIEKSNFHENDATYGGVIMLDNYIDAKFDDTPMFNNHAFIDGGAIIIVKTEPFVTIPDSTLEIVNCRDVYDNTAKFGGFANVKNP